jgi:hypothetical protein
MSRGSSGSLSRRRFLRSLLALPIIGLLPQRAFAISGSRTPVADAPVPAAATTPPVGGLDGVDAIGTVYLHLHPEEASVATLRTALGLKAGRDSRKGTRRLARRIATDFEAPDIISVDGWRMSRTEARWAALLHLQRSGVS